MNKKFLIATGGIIIISVIGSLLWMYNYRSSEVGSSLSVVGSSKWIYSEKKPKGLKGEMIAGVPFYRVIFSQDHTKAYMVWGEYGGVGAPWVDSSGKMYYGQSGAVSDTRELSEAFQKKIENEFRVKSKEYIFYVYSMVPDFDSDNNDPYIKE